MDLTINTNGLVKPAIELINKITDAVGWPLTKETPKKEGLKLYVDWIKSQDINPVMKAIMVGNAKKDFKKLRNQSNTIQIAFQYLEDSAQPQNIEDDWILRFMDKAGCVSSEEFQVIWGKVLARECNEPGSIPTTLLYALEKMDKEDAAVFSALCSITIQVEDSFAPLVISHRFGEYEPLGINLDGITNLETVGLIRSSLDLVSFGYSLHSKEIPTKITYFDEECEFEDKEIASGCVIFTKAGEALYRVVSQSEDIKKVDGFWENFCLKFWVKQDG